MGIPILLMQLEGVLQSWGTRSRWYNRDTGLEPSKSGIIGLLGGALGYARDDPRLETELDRQCKMGVRADVEGSLVQDYHTVTGTFTQADGDTRDQTLVTPKEYLAGASFLVALAGPARLLDRVASALAAPKWPVYLGRKACIPTRPVMVGLATGYDSVDDALARHPWTPEVPPRTVPGKLRCVVEDPAGDAVRQDARRVNPTRMFGTRRVREFWVAMPPPPPIRSPGNEMEATMT